MCGMFPLRVRVYKDVVQVGNCCEVEVCSDDIVDQCLTRCQCVGESERHDQTLVMSVANSERCLPFLSFLHPNEIVGSTQVQFREDCGLADPISEFVGVRQWVSVLDRNIVEFPIIDTKSKTAVFLLCKQNRVSCW